MKKCSSLPMLFLCLFFGTTLYAQQENVDTVVFRKIRNAEMKSSQIPSIAHYLTDVSGARLTSSAGYFRAGKWAVETLKKWGLVNATLEAWGEYGRGWDVDEFSISLQQPYTGFIMGYPMPWSNSTNGTIHAPVYKLLSSDLADSAFLAKHKDEFTGKIVLLTNKRDKHGLDDDKPFSERLTDNELMKMPDTYMIDRKQIEGFLKPMQTQNNNLFRLKAYGALAIVYANGGGRDGTLAVQSFSNYKTGTPAYLPEATISSEDGFKLNRLLTSGHPVELSLNIKSKFYTDDTKGYNVVAEIPGSDPKLKVQVVMLGGHLDSWTAATGATDNGAGCMVMMEAVRLLDSLHLQPKRTIRIALWGGEEEGLLGSYGYVKKHFGNAETGVTPEQATISAYFNLDNGTGKIRGVYAQGNKEVKPIFEQWLAPFNDLGAKTVTLSNTGSTDHLSFDWVGIPGFEFIQDPLDYETKTHHTNMDTYDYLRMDDLKQAAIIVASFVYQAGNRPDMLPRKKLVKETFVFDGL